ncbi:MAG: hypothetical protein AAB564_00065 [Patescibacteria group bacterium]
MIDKIIGDGILEIPALSLDNNIFLPGNEYKIKLDKSSEASEENFLKLKTILNERYQKQMEIAIVYLKQEKSSVYAREWGVLARIIGLSSLKIDALPFVLRVRIMGRCRILRFFRNKEQGDCFFAHVKISPVLAISEAEWRSDGIQKLKNDIAEDFYEFSAICAEISIIFSESDEDLEQKFVFLSLFSQKIAISIELCFSFEEFIGSISEWLGCYYSGLEAFLDLKFHFLSLDSERQQMQAAKNMINNFVGAAENKLSELKEDFPFFKGNLLSENDFFTENGQSLEKSEKEITAVQKKLLERLEEALKKLNALKKNLGGGKDDDIR